MNRVEYCLGGNYIRRNFLDCNNPSGNFMGGNFPGGSYPGWELSGWELSCVGIFFGGGFPSGNCPREIIWEAIFRVKRHFLRFSKHINIFQLCLINFLKQFSKSRFLIFVKTPSNCSWKVQQLIPLKSIFSQVIPAFQFLIFMIFSFKSTVRTEVIYC